MDFLGKLNLNNYVPTQPMHNFIEKAREVVVDEIRTKIIDIIFQYLIIYTAFTVVLNAIIIFLVIKIAIRSVVPKQNETYLR